MAVSNSKLPPALQQALAAPAVSGTLGSIAHFVILCQENRSFDHYFGTIKGARGFNDEHAASIQGTSRNVFTQATPTAACTRRGTWIVPPRQPNGWTMCPTIWTQAPPPGTRAAATAGFPTRA